MRNKVRMAEIINNNPNPRAMVFEQVLRYLIICDLYFKELATIYPSWLVGVGG
jgi:hypothetical protein